MKIRLPWLTVGIATVAIVSQFLPGAAAWLQYDRTAIAHGELWRHFTAHFVHFDVNHLGWDVAVLLIAGTACERYSRTACATALGLSIATVTPMLWVCQPHFEYYRGLSGLDCSLIGLIAGSLFQTRNPLATASGTLVLSVFSLKCGIEIMTAQTVFASGTSYVPVPLAHLSGMICGLAAAMANRNRYIRIEPITFHHRSTC
jgi:rhomboid family GlyGly-CTERM serine protease